MTQLTENFTLEELLRGHAADELVIQSLRVLAITVLQPARTALGHPFLITSGFRPEYINSAVGGSKSSQHIRGEAADFQVRPKNDVPMTWEEATRDAWTWMARNLRGKLGQLIYEDHRASTGDKNQLWVHASIPCARHPGLDDSPSRLMLSYKKGSYLPATEDALA